MINKDTYMRLTCRHPDGKHISILETKQLPKTRECELVLERLAELEDKIENGTLVELPCKVGDTVYHTDNVGDEIHEGKIKKIIYDLGYMAFDETAIGTGIFLTKETVEAKCKELQERTND